MELRDLGMTFLSLLFLWSLAVGDPPYPDVRDLSIDRFLEEVDYPAVTTWKSPHNVFVLCIRFEDQISLRYTNHKISTEEKKQYVHGLPEFQNSSSTFLSSVIVSSSSRHCPKGTIYKHETGRKRVEREGSVMAYFNKYHRKPHHHRHNNSSSFTQSNVETCLERCELHEYASVKFLNGIFSGTRAVLNIWKPHVRVGEEWDETSIAQVWFAKGKNERTNTAEAGWHVYPARNDDDDLPRFFVYWTGDNYHNKGCYNLECDGFVSLLNFPFINEGLEHSLPGIYSQKEMEIAIKKVRKQEGYVYSLYVNGVEIGYWKAYEIYNALRDFAEQVHWGGEIGWVSKYRVVLHTTTQMGSGEWSEANYGDAAYVRNIDLFDPQGKMVSEAHMLVSATHPNCYSVGNFSPREASLFEGYFFYGGPGFNEERNCLVAEFN